MAAVVLGKRGRQTTYDKDDTAVLTRAKRRQRIVLDNDENSDPFVVPADGASTQETTSLKYTCPAVQRVVPSRRRESGIEPVSSPRRGRKVLSPTKGNAQYQPHRQTQLQGQEGGAEDEAGKEHAEGTDVALAGQESKKPAATARLATPSGYPLTPQTPRHRNALAEKVLVTPRHRLIAGSWPATPRSLRTPATPASAGPSVYAEVRRLFCRSADPGRLLCRDAERARLTDFLEQKADTRSSGCLYVSGPPGTGKSALVAEVCRAVESGSGRGSGGAGAVRIAHLNCMTVWSGRLLCAKILESLFADEIENVSDDGLSASANEGESGEGKGRDEIIGLRRALARSYKKRKTVHVVVLDEVDHFVGIDIDLLYGLFQLGLEARSGLVLIAIANALDFTDRFLPKLKTGKAQVDLLPVMPYTAAQIGEIVTAKLKSLLFVSTGSDFVPFMQPTAIHFIANKVAAQSGDLRKALEICRAAIGLVESEVAAAAVSSTTTTTTTADATNITTPSSPDSPARAESSWPGGSNDGESTPSPSRRVLLKQMRSTVAIRPTSSSPSTGFSPKGPTADKAARATIAHAARITARIFGKGTVQRLAALNLQQKAALCALARLTRDAWRTGAVQASVVTQGSPVLASPRAPAAAPPTRHALYHCYSDRCSQTDRLLPLTYSEFREVVAGLEAVGLVVLAKSVDQSPPRQGPRMTGTLSRRGSRTEAGGGAGAGKSAAAAAGVGRAAVLGGRQDGGLASTVGPEELRALLDGEQSVENEILKALLDG